VGKRRLVPSKLGQGPLFMRNISVCIWLHSAKVFWANAPGTGITVYPIDQGKEGGRGGKKVGRHGGFGIPSDGLHDGDDFSFFFLPYSFLAFEL